MPVAAPRFKAVAFDYLVLFNPDSIIPEVERVFPGEGRALTTLWRTRQFEYAWLRYPTFWVNRFNQPFEELGVRPDNTSPTLDALVDLVLSRDRHN